MYAMRQLSREGGVVAKVIHVKKEIRPSVERMAMRGTLGLLPNCGDKYQIGKYTCHVSERTVETSGKKMVEEILVE
jgi:hypothetical protein